MDRVWDWLRENLTDWTMAKIYIGCAIAGGSIMVLQMGLGMLGIGDGDADVDAADADVDLDDGSLHLLSIRAIAGFLTFFGLVGWAGTTSGWGTGITAVAALLAGGSVMLLIASIMRMFRGLTTHGNVDPKQALGKIARVYLRVPAQRQGRGKITVSVQGRSLEFAAVTSGDALPTGAACRIVSLAGDDTFEVLGLDDDRERER